MQKEYKREDAYQHMLSMDLTPERFQFSIIDPVTKTILHADTFSVADFSKEGIADLLNQTYFSYEFGSYVLSAGGERNTLIPVDLFSHSKPKEIFKLNYPEPIDNLDYNRIPELGIVNIYEVPLWIKSLFVIRFPRIKIIHRSTVLLKGAFDQPTFKPKIHLFIENNHFYLLLTDRSKLQYYNRFDYKELADMVYYVLFVLEQKELDQNVFEILLYGVENNWIEENALQDFFSAKITISDQVEKGRDFIMAKQLLCV